MTHRCHNRLYIQSVWQQVKKVKPSPESDTGDYAQKYEEPNGFRRHGKRKVAGHRTFGRTRYVFSSDYWKACQVTIGTSPACVIRPSVWQGVQAATSGENR